MNESQRTQCPKCGGKWRSGSTICELCGFEEMRPISVGLFFINLAAVAPLTCLGYCANAFTLTTRDPGPLGSPLLWIGITLFVSTVLYCWIRPRHN